MEWTMPHGASETSGRRSPPMENQLWRDRSPASVGFVAIPFGASIDTNNSFERRDIKSNSGRRRYRMKPVMFAIIFAVLTTPVAGQWLHYPTPGIPRTPDGKPDLSAPVPKTPDGKPDLSGVWTIRNGNKYFQDLGADGVEIPMLPWAKALYEQRKANLQKGHPSERCLGHGVTDFDTVATPRKIIQTPQVIAILFEAYNQYRQILMDGRPLP